MPPTDDSDRPAPPGGPAEQTFAPGAPGEVPRLETPTDLRPRQGRGRRSYVRSERQGHYVRAVRPRGRLRDLAFDATLRAAAPFQFRRREGAIATTGKAAALHLSPADLRVKARRRRLGNLILFVVDASGSMAARRRMEAVKGATLSLLMDAYQKRDRVGLIAFRGRQAELLLPPTHSVELAERVLRTVPTGGRTPLAHALTLAGETLRKAAHGDESLVPLLVVVSDGRANVGLAGDPRDEARQAAGALAARGVASLVIDSEEGFVKLGLARELALHLGGTYFQLEQLHARAMRGAVRMVLD